MTMNKVFNADLIAAYNILLTPITSSPGRGRGNGRRPGLGLNLPTLYEGVDQQRIDLGCGYELRNRDPFIHRVSLL
jgi:hypothetical protein